MIPCAVQNQKKQITRLPATDDYQSKSSCNTFFYGLDLKSNRFLHVSSNVSSVFGYTKDEFIQRGLHWFVRQINPHDLKKLEHLSNQLNDSSVSPRICYRFKVKNGTYRRFSESRCLLYDFQSYPSFLISRVEMV